ncbi:MAG: hypothetical protein HRT35_17870, partial [Algicola sp.]|nr:hypothetical protein [Algicola sp.]
RICRGILTGVRQYLAKHTQTLAPQNKQQGIALPTDAPTNQTRVDEARSTQANSGLPSSLLWLLDDELSGFGEHRQSDPKTIANWLAGLGSHATIELQRTIKLKLTRDSYRQQLVKRLTKPQLLQILAVVFACEVALLEQKLSVLKVESAFDNEVQALEYLCQILIEGAEQRAGPPTTPVIPSATIPETTASAAQSSALYGLIAYIHQYWQTLAEYLDHLQQHLKPLLVDDSGERFSEQMTQIKSLWQSIQQHINQPKPANWIDPISGQVDPSAMHTQPWIDCFLQMSRYTDPLLHSISSMLEGLAKGCAHQQIKTCFERVSHLAQLFALAAERFEVRPTKVANMAGQPLSDNGWIKQTEQLFSTMQGQAKQRAALTKILLELHRNISQLCANTQPVSPIELVPELRSEPAPVAEAAAKPETMQTERQLQPLIQRLGDIHQHWHDLAKQLSVLHHDMQTLLNPGEADTPQTMGAVLQQLGKAILQAGQQHWFGDPAKPEPMSGLVFDKAAMDHRWSVPLVIINKQYQALLDHGQWVLQSLTSQLKGLTIENAFATLGSGTGLNQTAKLRLTACERTIDSLIGLLQLAVKRLEPNPVGGDNPTDNQKVWKQEVEQLVNRLQGQAKQRRQLKSILAGLHQGISRLEQTFEKTIDQQTIDQQTMNSQTTDPSLAIPAKEKPEKAQLNPVHQLTGVGIVLFGPFLYRFFDQLQYLDGVAFNNQTTARRAVQILHYLVFGQLANSSHAPVLLNLLCGVSASSLPLSDVEISEHEDQECQKLRGALIQHWPGMSAKTPAELLSQYLHRQGQLTERQKDWQLQPEPAAQDELLKTLPWGLSSIHLPWMAKTLVIDWKPYDR